MFTIPLGIELVILGLITLVIIYMIWDGLGMQEIRNNRYHLRYEKNKVKKPKLNKGQEIVFGKENPFEE